MKSIIVSMMVAAGLMVAGSAMATDMPAIAKKNNCTACHAIDKKVVGPAWMDISKKYKGDASAEAKLITKVSKGGSGVWGSMPMPANDPAGTKQADMKELVQFVLGLAK
ncbi:MAG: c-type cytochrome [Gallionella sp.]|nr:c-type cytochrome [Gallionella sp.]